MNREELVDQAAKLLEGWGYPNQLRHAARKILSLPAVAHALEIAQRYEEGREILVCGRPPYGWRPGKPLGKSCVFAAGHFDTCGTYRLVLEQSRSEPLTERDNE